MTPLCILAVLLAFLIGIGGATVLWAACTVSGAHAEQERAGDE